MTLCRLIAPDWALTKNPNMRRVLEGLFSDDQIAEHNAAGYNIYYLPNYPSRYDKGIVIDGSHIDTFYYIFVDCDLKDGVYGSKDEFIKVLDAAGISPSKIIDSGNGVHAYWKIVDLDAMSYLRFQRRLLRLFHTDEAVGQLFQLMRLPGTINTKLENRLVFCELLLESEVVYTSEEMNKLLPPITLEDEQYCKHHYDKTYGLNQNETNISDVIPAKFGKLLKDNQEVKDLWSAPTDDRSKNDFRLGHLMFANGFSKEEALSVLVNSAKALQRAPIHRTSYATNIVDKIWTFEQKPSKPEISPTVRELLSKGEETIKGIRFRCNKLIDDTDHGFRLGQVIGIIGGSGVGKTTLTLNAFLWFAENNPEYHHFFFSLEQPAGEIANRIRTICGGNDALYDKIHIVSNYGENDEYRHFSLTTIQQHLLEFQKTTGFKVGATVIDHIGVLSKETKNGENDGLIGVCREMKKVAIAVNTMLIMLSQAPREKAGVGDIELDKSAAYGTVFYEAFCDYCLCMWQPLKRAYDQGAPTVMAIKFAKIRHKNQKRDKIKEDICYQLYFDPETERLREMTQDEETSAKYFLGVATNIRKLDKKTELIPYQSRRVEGEASAQKTGPEPKSNFQ